MKPTPPAFSNISKAGCSATCYFESAGSSGCTGKALPWFVSVQQHTSLSCSVPAQTGMCMCKQELLAFANLRDRTVQNGRLGLKVWQERALRDRSFQSARLFFQELPGTHQRRSLPRQFSSWPFSSLSCITRKTWL